MGLFRKGKTHIIAKLHSTDLVICSLSRGRINIGHTQPFFDKLPYFFGYKTEFFSFQNNPKDLDPSCKMDLDLWDCLGRVKLVL